MNTRIYAVILAFLATFSLVTATRADDQTVSQSLGVLDEKVNRLTAQVEDVQFRYQQLQKDLEKISTELQELRRVAAGGNVSVADLKALEDRIQAVDAARQKDRQAIIDQLAKELAGVNPGKSPGKSNTSAPSDAKEHIVQKGETLSAIAKSAGVTVADLKKTNNLTGDDIKVGQKLAIPK